jgi:hypothetical protein
MNHRITNRALRLIFSFTFFSTISIKPILAFDRTGSSIQNKTVNGDLDTITKERERLMNSSAQQSNGDFAGTANDISNTANEQYKKSKQNSTGAEGSMGNGMASSDNASQASDEQSSGSGQNSTASIAMGAAGAAAIAASIWVPELLPVGVFLLLQSALGAMQASEQGDTSDANKQASGDFRTYGSNGGKDDKTGDNTKPNNNYSDKNKLGNHDRPDYGDDPYRNLSQGVRDNLAKMNSLGYKVDLKNKTFTTPDGHTISAKDANNAGSVESKLGLPPGTYNKGMEQVAEIMKRNGLNPDGPSVAAGGADGSGAGDGSGLADGEGYDGSGGKLLDKNKIGATGLRGPAAATVAGLTTSYNGERIGVAADDIFLMVNRRYKVKNDQDSFITADRPAKGVLGTYPRQ